jgi:hypothetical protein
VTLILNCINELIPVLSAFCAVTDVSEFDIRDHHVMTLSSGDCRENRSSESHTLLVSLSEIFFIFSAFSPNLYQIQYRGCPQNCIE